MKKEKKKKKKKKGCKGQRGPGDGWEEGWPYDPARSD